MKFEDITGQRFGRLLVIGYEKSNIRSYSYMWICRCNCNNIIKTNKDTLKSGDTKSCGCLRKEIVTKHGKSKSKIYKIWNSMRFRCNSKKSNAYKYYGGRGIKVCKRWVKFENFYQDMGERPKGTSLDRIDNNKGYCKKNCRWASKQIQSRNMRSNNYFEFNGKSQILKDWAEELNIPQGTLHNRIFKYKWAIEKALNTPRLNN